MDSPYIKYPVTINSITNETEDKLIKSFALSFINPEDSAGFFSPPFQPGQFAMLWVPGCGEIPLGIASSPGEKDNLLFTVSKAGKVTSKLHSLANGDTLGVRGPLGNGFPWQNLHGKNLFLIGGGFAFSVLRSSLQFLLSPEVRQNYKDIWVFYGARTPGMLLYRDEFKEWKKREDVKIHLTVDANDQPDWEHHVGNIPTILHQELPVADENSVAIVCGPPVMIKFSILSLKQKGFLDQNVLLSLENRMKCGIGHCGRCSIGKTCVCVEGPVFSMAETEKMPSDF